MAIFGYPDPKSPVGYNITPQFQQLIGSLMTLGAFIASGFSGPLAQFLGRKTCLWIACIMCCVSDAIMCVYRAYLMFETRIPGLCADIETGWEHCLLEDCILLGYS